MTKSEYDLGMIGLGVMGCNLVLNFTGHGTSVAAFDIDLSRGEALIDYVQSSPGDARRIAIAADLREFTSMLSRPRTIMVMVPPGTPVDAVIQNIAPYLEPGDLLIDGGNSYFKDTDRRIQELAEVGVDFLGVGISGGARGARYGPSIMPGGRREAYQRVQSIFEATAAKVNGEPCVAYLGPGSAGHYVKMVHNGIEYGLMQLIAESYDLFKRGLGLAAHELHDIYQEWNSGELNSYLIEITADIFKKVDEKTGESLINLIVGEAQQKGTGRWSSQDAMDIGVPVPTIDMAVVMRNLSSLAAERVSASKLLAGPANPLKEERDYFIQQVRSGLYSAMLITYAQGMAQLGAASAQYGYNLDLETAARIWRGGCIIRAALLEDIRAAYRQKPELPNVLLDASLSKTILERQPSLRSVVRAGTDLGLPVPGFMASLAYFDGYRSPWLPANLVQAQRDYFGAHTYERVDIEGVFHTDWETLEEVE